MRRGAELHPIRSRLAELSPIDALRRRSDGPGPRWAPGGGAALAMVLLAMLAAVAAGCWVWAGRPHRMPVALAGQVAAAPAGSAVSGPLLSSTPSASSRVTSSPAGVLVVDVVGRVHRPGVYRLPPGSRVTDAVTAAGGVLAGVDPATVNLARKLSDGEQLVIGRPAAAAPTGTDAGTGSADPSGPVDLNSATVAQLDALPGVGPVLAQRIVDWRTQHGRFDSVAQLRSVSGIGDSKFADLAPLVTAG
ncbi:MAG TPA: ComEA family DNA-binding protein [Jatrophihabitans sp.]|nr:ComEA family DNA-binding protein [Jatrophihabitans sp.]